MLKISNDAKPIKKTEESLPCIVEKCQSLTPNQLETLPFYATGYTSALLAFFSYEVFNTDIYFDIMFVFGSLILTGITLLIFGHSQFLQRKVTQLLYKTDVLFSRKNTHTLTHHEKP